MEAVGLRSSELSLVYSVLSAILNLSRISFTASVNPETKEEAAQMQDEAVAAEVASLLGLQEKELVFALCHR